MIWARFPFVRWMLALGLGMALWIGLSLKPFFGASVPIALLLLAAASIFLLKKRRWRHFNAISGSLMFVAIAAAGWHWAHNNTVEASLPQATACMGTVAALQQGDARTQAVIDVWQFKDSVGWHECDVKAMVSWPTAENLRIGQHILLNSALLAPHAPKNPSTFNYGKYLAIKQIHASMYRPVYRTVGKKAKIQTAMLDWAQRAGNWLEQALKAYLPHQTSYDISRALLLGRKTGIDTDLRDAYAKAGAMHVLAVSGLHVGILFGICAALLYRLGKHGAGPWVRLALLLLVLWGYAMLTGLSASVVRASIMCSLLAIGQAAKRRGNAFNTVAAAAFGMLLYDPWWLADVGFQLSFTAVLGILLCYRPLFILAAPSNWLVQKVWQLLCVSMAAQLGTLPLGLYYFHQFPAYFLLANLIVVPIAGVLLGGSIVLTLASVVPPVATAFGFVLSWVIHGMNWAVAWVGALPNQNFEGIHIAETSVLLMYFLLGSLLAVYYWQRIWPMWLALFASVGLCLIEYAEKEEQSAQQWAASYALGSRLNVALVQGSKAYWLADSLDMRYQQQVLPHLQQAGATVSVRLFSELPGKLPLAQIGDYGWLLVWKGQPMYFLKNAPDTLLVPKMPAIYYCNNQIFSRLKRKPVHAQTWVVPYKPRFSARKVYALHEEGAWVKQ